MEPLPQRPWGYRLNTNLAMAYIDPEFAEVGTGLSVLLLGQTVRAEVVEPCLYDPGHLIPRGL